MKRSWFPSLSISAAAALCLALSSPANVAMPGYEKTYLLSDGAVAARNFNSHLVNPWGLASSPTGPFWIANEGTGTSSIARADGLLVARDVHVPDDESGHPTGLVFNGDGGFLIRSGGVVGSSVFLFVTLEGRVLGWNPSVDAENAIVAADHGSDGAVYTGAAIAGEHARRFLYAANFGGGSVDVFDQDFDLILKLRIPGLPPNYAPFGIAAIDGRLFVTSALRDPTTGEDVPGSGNGYIHVMDPDGSNLEVFAFRGELNAPWGLVQAPGGFGMFSQKLLVGNFGDGRILAFNIHNGQFLGALEDEDGEPIVIRGIWGLLFGNGGAGGDPHDLYFTAGIQDEEHGVFGEIEVAH